MANKDRFVMVCSECLMASCWHGDFLCEKSQGADTKLMWASELRRLKLEHPSWYSVATMKGGDP